MIVSESPWGQTWQMEVDVDGRLDDDTAGPYPGALLWRLGVGQIGTQPCDARPRHVATSKPPGAVQLEATRWLAPGLAFVRFSSAVPVGANRMLFSQEICRCSRVRPHQRIALMLSATPTCADLASISGGAKDRSSSQFRPDRKCDTIQGQPRPNPAHQDSRIIPADNRPRTVEGKGEMTPKMVGANGISPPLDLRGTSPPPRPSCERSVSRGVWYRYIMSIRVGIGKRRRCF